MYNTIALFMDYDFMYVEPVTHRLIHESVCAFCIYCMFSHIDCVFFLITVLYFSFW